MCKYEILQPTEDFEGTAVNTTKDSTLKGFETPDLGFYRYNLRGKSYRHDDAYQWVREFLDYVGLLEYDETQEPTDEELDKHLEDVRIVYAYDFEDVPKGGLDDFIPGDGNDLEHMFELINDWNELDEDQQEATRAYIEVTGEAFDGYDKSDEIEIKREAHNETDLGLSFLEDWKWSHLGGDYNPELCAILDSVDYEELGEHVCDRFDWQYSEVTECMIRVF